MPNITTYEIKIESDAKVKLEEITEATEKTKKGVFSLKESMEKLRDAGLAFDAVKSQADKLASVFVDVFNSGMETELQKQNIQTLLGGDIEAADELFQKLTNFGKATPYDKKSLIEAEKTMLSFGISSDKAFNTLQNIGDIALGDKDKMSSLSLAFSQVTSTGKLMGQDLLQMINAGFNPLQVISDKTGKSMATLKDEMSKGAISADMIAQAFQWATEEGSQFYQGAEKASQTVAGRLSTLKDNVTEIAVQLFNVLEPAISKVMTVAASLVNFVQEHKTLVAVVGVGLGALTLALKGASFAIGVYESATALATVATASWAAIQSVLNAILSANPIGLIVVAVVALIALVTAIVKKWDEWGAAISIFMGPLGLVISMVQSFRANWDSVVNAFKSDGIIGGIKRIGIVLIDALLKPVQQLLELVSNIPGVGNLAGKGASKIKSLRDSLGLKDNTIGTNDSLKAATTPTKSGVSTSGLSGGSSSENTSSVSQGGQRSTDIHINIEDMIKTVNFNGTTSENKQDIERNFAECLYRVLGMAQVSVN